MKAGRERQVLIVLEYISTTQFAELKGCSPQYVRRLIADNKIVALENEAAGNNRKEYIIPIETLTPELQKKYYSNIRKDVGLPSVTAKESKPQKSIDEYTQSQRNEIALLTKIIKDWQSAREQSINKSDFDKAYVGKIAVENPGINISVRTLYRKYKAYRDNDLDGLLDNRGGNNKKCSKIPNHILDAFFYFYLDERKLSVSLCYQLTLEWVQEFYPQDYHSIHSERTFRRKVNDIPEAVIALCRKGEKALKDNYIPYIERLYEDLKANDVWVGDNHTFDFITIGEGGKQHRLHLTAFIDAKSGILVGWNITDNPSSQSTLLALRDGILKFGVPKSIYVDNGSEFLTHDIGGRGHRSRSKWNKDDLPPTILQMLDIDMHNALVRNAKAKPIERTFGTLKEHISRVIETFCGGTILERPESLKYKLKHGIIPEDEQIRKILGTLINGIYNMDLYGGKERCYKDMTRIDVWNESIKSTLFRKASAEDLNLLLARTGRYQKIGRNGVWIAIKGEKLWYTHDELWKYQGEEVYVRYDPADISQVRVYGKDEKYMFNCWLSSDIFVDYITDNPEDIATAEKMRRKTERNIKEYAKGLTDSIQGDKRIDFLDMQIRKATRMEAEYKIKQPSKFIPVLSDKIVRENPKISEIIEIDFTKVNNNAEKRRGY